MSQIKQRIFIVGTPRSGTTLLQSFLVSHSNIHSFPETHFFSAIAVNTARRYNLMSKKKITRYNKLLNGLLGEKGETLKTRCLLAKTTTKISEFISILDSLTEHEHKTIWVEKTPAHLHSIDYIEKQVPECIFIHIIRNGKEVVTSLVEVTKKYPDDWGGKRSIESCVKRWNEDMAIALAYNNKPKHFFVRYEKLVESPETTLRALCNFIGINFEEGMLSERTKNASAIIRSEESWKAKNLDKLSRRNNFETLLTTEEQNYVNKSLGDYKNFIDEL